MAEMSRLLEDEVIKLKNKELELEEKTKLFKKLKIKKIYIENHKMFKKFNLKLTKNNNINSIIVLAGINGTGKTTLLEFINDFINYLSKDKDNKSFIEVEYYENGNENTIIINYNSIFEEYHNNGPKNIFRTAINRFFNKNIIYFSTNQTINNIKEILPKYIEQMIYEKDIKASEVYKNLRDYINLIFDGLNLKIEFDSRDGEGNIFFKNKNGEKFSIDKLSTGEKTLLSKVLYLYINEIKNKVILIDEPELSLHPSWQNKVLRIYENFANLYNCQIIIATHSPHIIQSAKNEYLRVLKFNEDNNIEVVENLYSHGRDINSVLFDTMEETPYRPIEFNNKIDLIHSELDNKNFKKAKELLKELKKSYGENDSVIIEIELLLNIFDKQD